MQKNTVSHKTSVCLSWRWAPRLFLLFLSGLLAACGDSSSRTEAPFLSGTITMEPGTRVDQDTAQVILAEGQVGENPQRPVLPADVVLGGYVSNGSGNYANGLPFPRDQKDHLLLPMSAGQGVSLRLFNSMGGEQPIDVHTQLFLGEDLVDETTDTDSRSRVLMAEHDGEHRLEITAASGPPVRYLISSAAESSSDSMSLLEADFVPGEALVTLRPPQPGLLSIADMPDSVAQSRSLGGRHHRVSMSAPIQPLDEGSLSAQTARMPDQAATMEWIRQLQEDPAVASASPNYRVKAMADPRGQQFYDLQRWHYELVGLDAAWNDGFSGEFEDENGNVQRVRVAVLDTGLFNSDEDALWHKEINPNVDCDFDNSIGCFNAIEPGTAPEDTGEPTGSGLLFHGTHVSGTVAADVNNTTQFGGIAFQSQLIPVKVLDGESGTLADVIAGIQWVVNDGGPPRAEMINLSLGTSANASALEQSLAEAREAGILVAAAAGNESSRRRIFPAAYDSVLAVGAVNCSGTLSGFSNFGFWLDLVAPGGGANGGDGSGCNRSTDSDSRVWSAAVDEEDNETIGPLAGTSMASPHVAGVLALLLERADLSRRHLLPPIVDALVREQRLVSSGNPRFNEREGYGLVDASGLSGLGDITGLSVLTPDRRRVIFRDGESEQRLQLHAQGHSPDTVTEVSVVDANDDPWLQVDSDGGSFLIRLDRDLLPESDGSIRGDLKVSYRSDGEQSFLLPVTVLRSLEESQRNAGIHFLQLIPVNENGERTGGEVIQQELQARDGRYQFRFDPREIPEGDYLLVAGSDLDNNGFFCGAGEACARFPRTEEPRPITITPDTRRDLTFSTSYRLPVSISAGPHQRQAD